MKEQLKSYIPVQLKYVLLESPDKKINEVHSGPINHYMVQQNYTLFAKTVLTLIF